MLALLISASRFPTVIGHVNLISPNEHSSYLIRPRLNGFFLNFID